VPVLYQPHVLPVSEDNYFKGYKNCVFIFFCFDIILYVAAKTSKFRGGQETLLSPILILLAAGVPGKESAV